MAFLGILKNENYVAQFTYMKIMSEKGQIHIFTPIFRFFDNDFWQQAITINIFK